MKRILAAGAMLVGTAVSAQAADMAAKAPYLKAPVLAVYNWTGFYIGANAGVGIGRNRTGHSFTGDSLYLAPQGGFGGGQIGYNWQGDSLLGPIVYGIEADIQGAGLDDNHSNVLGTGGLRTAYSSKVDWFGTVRGRIGLSQGPVLSYFTGGYAYGNVKTSITEGGVAAFSQDRMQSGWTVGSGVEAALGGNWTGKVEYLYLNLGNKTDAFTAVAVPQTFSTEIRENIFRVGLNYRINGNAAYAPVAARNWAGLYLGGNVGSGTGRDRSSLAVAGLGTEQFNLSPDGIVGGGQIGYNWQAGNWVYGVEADFQGSSQKDNKTTVALGTAAYDAKLPWFGTARGRLGYAFNNVLIYGTAGLAFGSLELERGGLQQSHTSLGWTAGVGAEVGIYQNWTAKIEYLYVDLSKNSYTLLPTAADSALSFGAVRIGVNYHF